MTTHTIHATGGAPFLGDLAQSFMRVVAAIAAGARAAHDWDRLTAMTDAGLAREGIDREHIARAVLERNFR